MRRWLAVPAMVFSAVVLVLPMMTSSLTNTIRMNGTTIGQADTTVTANNIKPPQCSPITVTAVATNDSGTTVTGTAASELILGTPANTTFVGGAGDDCIITPDSGTFTVDGGDGNDVCIGTGDTTFTNCETVYKDGVLQT